MRVPHRLHLLVLVAAGLLLLARLGEMPLLDPDEGRNARVAWEMKESGAWFVPTYDGLPYLDKPAAYFKAVALSFALFGRSESAARLPSVLCGAALLLAAYAFARRAFGGVTAALSVLVAVTIPLFVVFSRMVIFDMPLALFVSLSIFAVFRAEEEKAGGARPGSVRLWHALGAAFAAIATLIKGPVGFLVPGLVQIVVHALRSAPAGGPGRSQRDPASRGARARGWIASRNWGFLARAFSPVNLLVFFGLTVPWFFGVLHRRPDFAHYGLVEETLRRYSTTAFHRTAPVYYYIPVVLATFFPWSLLLPESMAEAWKRRRSWTPADRLLVLWAVTVVVFFSTSQSKLPGYILSIAVPVGILTARVLSAALRDPSGRAAAILRRATAAGTGIALLLVLVSITQAGSPGALQRLFHIRSSEFDRTQAIFGPLALTFGMMAALGLGALVIGRRPRSRGRMSAALSLGAFLVFPVSLLTLCFGGLVEYARAGSSKWLIESMGAAASTSEVAALECWSPGLPYYLDREVSLITEDAHELTSNYVAYLLRSRGQREAWPDPLVPRERLVPWVAHRSGPLYVLSRKRALAALDSLAASEGATVRPLGRGWYGLALAAPRNER